MTEDEADELLDRAAAVIIIVYILMFILGMSEIVGALRLPACVLASAMLCREAARLL